MDFCLPGRTFGVLECLGGQKKLMVVVCQGKVGIQTYSMVGSIFLGNDFSVEEG